jgi:O-antigen/teichoic acid export membrane protein
LSWISGYFIFNLFTPIIFANQGAIEAGKIGISLSIFNALLALAMSWVNVKVPIFAAHIARNEREQLNKTFIEATKASMIFTIIFSFIFLFLFYLLDIRYPSVTNRLANLPILICFSLVTMANCFIFSAAVYMRSHKEEPMLFVSVVIGVISLGVIFFGSLYSVVLPIVLYCLTTLFLALPWTFIIFLKYFRRTT